MNVLYDDRGLRLPFGGIPRCYAEIIKRLPKDISWQIAAKRTENIYFQLQPYNMKSLRIPLTRDVFVRDFLRGHYIHGVDRAFSFIRRNAPWLLRDDHSISDARFRALVKRADLIHLTEPHYFNYDWKDVVKNKPFVVTVHDLIPDMFWWKGKFDNYRRDVLNSASAVIAVSEFTRQCIIDRYSISSSKIQVIRHGYNNFEGIDSAIPHFGFKYILYMGNRNDYKNFTFFLKAIAPVLRRRSGLMLVCTGPKFIGSELDLFRREGVCNKVVHYFVPENEMRSIYANAEVFVYPSRIEGFGIPILDAFAAKCPVVLSRCSCFPEVAGDAALYFEDGDAEGVRSAVDVLIDQPAMRIEMIKRGTDRLSKYSWDKAARELADVYRRVLR